MRLTKDVSEQYAVVKELMQQLILEQTKLDELVSKSYDSKYKDKIVKFLNEGWNKGIVKRIYAEKMTGNIKVLVIHPNKPNKEKTLHLKDIELIVEEHVAIT